MTDLHLVLVHPEIPWNAGSVGRTCLALGAELHLVQPLGFALDARSIRRSGLDYWRHVHLTVHESFASLERVLADLGEPWFLSAKGGFALWGLPLKPPAVFVLGGESRGLPVAVREKYTGRTVHIPQDHKYVRSLNLSTAAAIAAYEFRRRFPAGIDAR